VVDNLIGTLAAVALIVAMSAPALFAQPEPLPPETKPEAADPYVLDVKVKDIKGHEVDLAQYKGKVILIVNVASKCGYTTQYEGLQKLYEKHKDDGLVILGFPANDFREQEPGTEEEIAEFCKANYGVTFPLFSKISVKGDHQHPLYQKLTSQPEPIGGDPKWNFTKFVVNREGNVVARFDAERQYIRTAELEPGLVKQVEDLLDK
jgi:glutathione peroxidase